MALELKNLPPWGQAALAVAVAAGVVMAAHMAYPNLNQMKKKNLGMQADLDRLEQIIKRGRMVEENLPKVEKEIENLRAKLDDLRQILPTEPETGDLLAWIKNLSDQSNLELKKFAPGGLKLVANTYKEFPISMDIVGAYHDLGIFFDRVSKYSRIININNVVINRNTSAGGKTIRSTFTATTFILEDIEEPAAPAAAGGKS
jgi:type IV pilus assembly protein PilO